MADSDEIRVGDPERQRAVELLGEAMATGYLTVDEFDQRTHAAYGATNRGELQSIVNDLPIRDRLFPRTVAERAADTPPEELDIEWTTVHRKGVWTAPARMRISGSMGTANIDFRRADLPYGEVEVDLQVSMSSVKVRLSPTMRVDVSGIGRSGLSSVKDRSGPPEGASGPLVVIKGSVSAGSTIVLRR
ncbi:MULTISPECIES: DUF1707 domain-containing protein [Tsukamurella]|uniref:DUF1707 domain-containing protein n=2 Tax=Tsukamurella TaxID=2060 RepID=A0A5C5S238_9ACTN|nr:MULTISPECIES: DUF1707 domain-containing protein [Tsukamurella]NMD57684.1 DUF1707 domain-containing protein [Tsukamurella columbiensis]TWS29104.1 DUF1707 domain-containing protein [Tsukamurella conjunctivitidis]